MTLKQLREAVQTYFSDTSRPPAQTKADLESLVEDIEMMIESIPDEDTND